MPLSVTAVGTAAIATFGFKGAKDAKLPITVGPQTSGAVDSSTHGPVVGGGEGIQQQQQQQQEEEERGDTARSCGEGVWV